MKTTEQKLSDAELNRRVAELCGWRFIRQGAYVRAYSPSKTDKDIELLNSEKSLAQSVSDSCKCNTPDYCSDLNAMHKAEKMLLRPDPKRWLDYLDRLTETSNLDYEVHATARQRAEAFVAVFSK